jgi:hypothetical protein
MQIRDYIENPQILIDIPQLGTVEYIIAANASAEITVNPTGAKVIKDILSEATKASEIDLFEINLDETPIGFIFGEKVTVRKNGETSQASYDDMLSSILLLFGLNKSEQDMKKFIYTKLEESGNRILSLIVNPEIKNFRERDFGVTINAVYRNS